MERLEEAAHVERVDVVADLLALVAVDAIGASLLDRLRDVGEEAVQLRRRECRGPVRQPPRRQTVGMPK